MRKPTIPERTMIYCWSCDHTTFIDSRAASGDWTEEEKDDLLRCAKCNQRARSYGYFNAEEVCDICGCTDMVACWRSDFGDVVCLCPDCAVEH